MIIVRVESQWTLFADTTDYFLTSCYVEHLNTTFIDYSQNCFTTPQYLMGSSYNSPISHSNTTNILEDEKLFFTVTPEGEHLPTGATRNSLHLERVGVKYGIN